MQAVVDEQQVVEQARAGEREAFGALYDRFAPDVQRLLSVMRLGLSAQDLEDAVQDTFVRLHRSLARYDGSRPLRPFVLGIARHVAVDRCRRRARSGRHKQAAPEPTPEPSAAEQAARGERATLIQQALDALEPELRAAIALRHQGELSMQAVGAALGCSQPTARARLREASHRLAVELRRRGLVPGRVV